MKETLNPNCTAYITGIPGKSRDAKLLEQLSALGIKTSPGNGVIPLSDVVPESDFNLGALGYLPQLGHLGCRLAHLRAIKSFLQSEYEFCIIFEDDALITSDFHLEKIQAKFSQSCKPKVLILGSKADSKPMRSYLCFDRDWDCLIYGPPYSYAYALNREAAKLISQGSDFHGPRGLSDWPPELAGNAKFYLAKTVMAQLADVETTISHSSEQLVYSAKTRIKALMMGLFISRSIPLKFLIFDIFIRNTHIWLSSKIKLKQR